MAPTSGLSVPLEVTVPLAPEAVGTAGEAVEEGESAPSGEGVPETEVLSEADAGVPVGEGAEGEGVSVSATLGELVSVLSQLLQADTEGMAGEGEAVGSLWVAEAAPESEADVLALGEGLAPAGMEAVPPSVHVPSKAAETLTEGLRVPAPLLGEGVAEAEGWVLRVFPPPAAPLRELTGEGEGDGLTVPPPSRKVPVAPRAGVEETVAVEPAPPLEEEVALPQPPLALAVRARAEMDGEPLPRGVLLWEPVVEGERVIRMAEREGERV